MNKIEGFDAIIVQGTPRFRLNNRLIAADKVPEDIRTALIADIQDKDKVRTVEAPAGVSAPTEPTDFLGKEITGKASSEETPQSITGSSIDYTELELELLEKVDNLERALASVETDASTGVPETLSASALGELLLKDFGIYTALAQRDPEIGDIHPFTLTPMNRYDTGLAYVSRKRALGKEITPVQAIPVPQENPVDNGGFQSFDERMRPNFKPETSATMRQHVNDPISEEATAEPNLRGQTIRKYW